MLYQTINLILFIIESQIKIKLLLYIIMSDDDYILLNGKRAVIFCERKYYFLSIKNKCGVGMVLNS